jgi:2,4-dienoyl-CoA reductase (NADPH2)
VNYPLLARPLEVHGVSLRNRIVMGSMHTGLEDRARDYPKLAAFLAARAHGGAALLVTGGVAPNRSGRLTPFGARLASRRHVKRHQLLTDAVHAHGARLCLQILHAGRYGYHPLIVSASRVRSPISRFTPRALSPRGIHSVVNDFTRCAELAQLAGYDGVEIMGSEGYLLNQFWSPRTNQRDDEWGGGREQRARLMLDIVRAVRAATGRQFLLMFRLSALELVEGGNTLDDTLWLAAALEDAGASLIDTGIGWHESRVPTIAGCVPRAAFAEVTRQIRAATRLPVIATNRINDPQVAEQLLASGAADLVSMARPLLADPELPRKSLEGREPEINTCIACNQGCLDRVFRAQRATCLVNPRAAYETELVLRPAAAPKRIAVVGAGPAGLAFATAAAERGHRVILYERDTQIGGQFRYAREVPGKEEFRETLRYFHAQLLRLKVQLRLGVAVTTQHLQGEACDEVVIATGVRPRVPDIAGINHPRVISYPQLLSGERLAGKRVAIIGAGGIGFDVATFLSAPHIDAADVPGAQQFFAEWGVTLAPGVAGGLLSPVITQARRAHSPREIYLLQRKAGRLGVDLAPTTGWIHRRALAQRGVHMLAGVAYQRIDNAGLHFRAGGS